MRLFFWFCVALAVGSGCKLMQEIAQYKDSAAAYDQACGGRVKLPETRPEPSEGSETEHDSRSKRKHRNLCCAPRGGLRRPSS